MASKFKFNFLNSFDNDPYCGCPMLVRMANSHVSRMALSWKFLSVKQKEGRWDRAIFWWLKSWGLSVYWPLKQRQNLMKWHCSIQLQGWWLHGSISGPDTDFLTSDDKDPAFFSVLLTNSFLTATGCQVAEITPSYAKSVCVDVKLSPAEHFIS